MKPERPGPTRDELLDHDADGIREFDNALPRWWLYGFYFTIAFACAYMLNYHVLAKPLVGKGGMIAEYQAEVLAAEALAAARGPAPTAAVSMVALTDAASLEKGKAIFEGPDNVCSSCHRPDLGGLVGPNLTDDYWLHGCSMQEIITSIKTGYPLKGMLPFGTGKPLTDEQALLVASYVKSRHGGAPPNPKPSEPERDKECR
jgi:cytochrome c oxidase cbb3-type subunit III